MWAVLTEIDDGNPPKTPRGGRAFGGCIVAVVLAVVVARC